MPRSPPDGTRVGNCWSWRWSTDAGFDPRYFAQALRAVDRWPDREYEVYGINGGQVEDMRRRLRAWAAEILGERLDEK
nr:hypothetical protein OH820_14995 [Streptomyces sp. NBC_00857]